VKKQSLELTMGRRYTVFRSFEIRVFLEKEIVGTN